MHAPAAPWTQRQAATGARSTRTASCTASKGDIRDYPKWRKISATTRSDLGKRCRAGFANQQLFSSTTYPSAVLAVPEVFPQTGPGMGMVCPWAILVLWPARRPQAGSHKPTGKADVGARLRATRPTTRRSDASHGALPTEGAAFKECKYSPQRRRGAKANASSSLRSLRLCGESNFILNEEVNSLRRQHSRFESLKE
jgi:hypothetical protein